MREIFTYGEVGGLGERSPDSTRNREIPRSKLKDLFQEAVSSHETKANLKESFYLKALKNNSKRYSKQELIAEGGMKRVLRVFDNKCNRFVALAQLKETDDKYTEAFIREALLTAQLHHPNIIAIHEIGLNKNDQPYFTMDLKSGKTLHEIILDLAKENHSIKIEENRKELLQIFLKICDAVSYVHSKKIIHLDLKPENIQVGLHGEVLVCDWGLAKVIGKDNQQGNGECEQLMLDGDLLNQLTLKGSIKGTPSFMAPEQINEKEEKREYTDIYALGCILYNLLCLKQIYQGNTEEILAKTLKSNFVEPMKATPHLKIPKSLNAIVLKCCRKQPNLRYQSIRELQDDVNKYLLGHATEAENASFFKLAGLLYRRNLLLCNSLFVTFLVLVAVTGFFTIELKSKEHLAKKNALIAIRNEKLARKNERIAIEALDKHLATQKKYQNTLRDDAENFIKLRDFEPAYQKLKSALEVNPDDKVLLEEFAHLNFTLLEFNEAIEYYEKAGVNKHFYRLSKQYAKEFGGSGAMEVDDIWGLIKQIPDSYPIKEKIIIYQGLQKKNKKDYVFLVKKYLTFINPDWQKMHFAFHKSDRSLKVRGEGFEKFNTKGKGQLLDCLNLMELDISGTSVDNVLGFRDSKIIKINIAHTKIDELLKLRKLKYLKTIVVHKGQFTKEAMKEMEGRYDMEFEVVD